MATGLLAGCASQVINRPKLTEVTALLDGRDFLANRSVMSLISRGTGCSALDAYSVDPQDGLVGHVG